MKYVEPDQIPSTEKVLEAMNKRKAKLKESSKQQVFDILFPPKK